MIDLYRKKIVMVYYIETNGIEWWIGRCQDNNFTWDSSVDDMNHFAVNFFYKY